MRSEQNMSSYVLGVFEAAYMGGRLMMCLKKDGREVVKRYMEAWFKKV